MLNQMSSFWFEKTKNLVKNHIIDVPDPTGEKTSWVDYHWQSFGNYLPKFGKDIQIIRTHELYHQGRMKKVISEIIENKDQIRKILNKYRKEKPFPEDWIPFNPLCNYPVCCDLDLNSPKALKILR